MPVVTVICVAVLACAALVAFSCAAVFRSAERTIEKVGEQVGDYIDVAQASDGYIAAIRHDDRAAFSAVWCADPPPGEGPDDQQARLEASKRTHGPITAVTQTDLTVTPPVARLAYEVAYGTTLEHWQATLREEPAGWRICGARPAPAPAVTSDRDANTAI